MELDGNQFISISGEISQEGMGVSEMVRNGVDGKTIILTGKRSVASSVRTTATTPDQSSAHTLEDTYAALRGKIVSYTHVDGKVYPTTLVRQVTTVARPMSVSSNGHEWMVNANIVLETMNQGGA